MKINCNVCIIRKPSITAVLTFVVGIFLLAVATATALTVLPIQYQVFASVATNKVNIAEELYLNEATDKIRRKTCFTSAVHLHKNIYVKYRSNRCLYTTII